MKVSYIYINLKTKHHIKGMIFIRRNIKVTVAYDFIQEKHILWSRFNYAG